MSSARKETLHNYFSKHNAGDLDPILTSLNGDNSWLISFPVPADKRTTKAFYHIVSDVWLSGYAITGSAWLVQIGLPAPAAITSGAQIDLIIQEIETAAADAGLLPDTKTKSEANPTLDAIFLNFHYADHISEASLRTFAASTPVFATPEAAAIIAPWSYFDSVTLQKQLEPSNPNWQTLHPGGTLPSWLSVFRIPGHHELNFATILVWTSSSDTHSALLYSPHGIYTSEPGLQSYAHALTPAISTRAMLHALKDNFGVGKRFTLGVEGGLALERLLKPKYWVKSHDALLDYRGAFMRLFVRDYARTLESAMKEGEERPNLVEVENGACFVLE